MRTHSENRKVCCGICFRKAKELRQITPTHLTQLQTLVDSRYDTGDPKFQTVICKSCVLSLAAHSSNPDNPEKGRQLLKPNYDNMIPPPVYATRNTEDQLCPCTQCLIARENITPGTGAKVLKEMYWLILFPNIPYPAIKVGYIYLLIYVYIYI